MIAMVSRSENVFIRAFGNWADRDNQCAADSTLLGARLSAAIAPACATTDAPVQNHVELTELLGRKPVNLDTPEFSDSSQEKSCW